MAREKTCLGVDIGASSVKICQLKRVARGFALERFGMLPLPSETVVDGTLMNASRVVEALVELVRSHKLRHKQVALSIAGSSVIIKKISLPQMTREALDASIQTEAEQFIPFDIRDVYMDVQLLGPSAAQPGQMDVVLVAAKREFVDEYTAVIRDAGLEPIICDVDAFAVENSFQASYEPSPEQTVALVNVGAAKTNINIVAGGSSCFTRDVAIGGSSFTEEIQKALAIPQEEAEALKLGGSDNVPSALAPRVTQALQLVADTMTSDIQRSIDFYGATSADPAPAAVYLSGGSARLQVLAHTIQERLGVPVHTMDVFRRLAPGNVPPALIAEMGPAAAVAVGLALRHPGDG